jgi:hypothetical protein
MEYGALIRDAWRLTWRHRFLWLIGLVAGGGGGGVWALAGLSAPTVAYGVVAGLALLCALLVVVGVANTFLWNYWTLAYLRLTGHGAAA